MSLKSLFVLVALLSVLGCSKSVIMPSGGDEVVDPILTWDPVLVDCLGNTLTSTVTYNVYVVGGTGPIPTAPSADASPCGVINLATIPPLNTAPIAAATYNAIVTDGVWTFAVEAVLVSGARSGLSAQVTRTVRNRGAAPGNVQITKLVWGKDDSRSN